MSDFIAVKGKIDTEIKQAVLDLGEIKTSLVEIGLDVDNKKSCEYAGLISGVKPSLDKLPILEAEVQDLRAENTILNNDNEHLTTENEQLNIDNEQLSEDNEQLTEQVNTLTEQGAENVLIIDDAILAVQEKGGTVEDKNQLGNSIRALSGIVLNNLNYFFYKDCRNVDTLWADLVTGNITSMSNMLNTATLTGGNTYLLDLSSCLTQETVTNIFNNTVANGGIVNIPIKISANNSTLYAVMYNGKVNTYGWNISFTDDTDCSGLNILLGAFRQNKIANIDLSNISTAPLTDVSYMLRDSTIENSNLCIDTSNVNTFAHCFYGVTANNGLNLSSWRFKQGALLNNMFNASKFTDGKVINFGDTLFINVGMTAMFKDCPSITESPILNIQDNTDQQVNYAYQEMFYGCSKLVKINYTNPWILCSNTTDMCRGCTKLTSLPPITFLCISGGNRNSISAICYNCSSLTEVTINIIYVDGEALYMTNAFYGCSALSHIKGNLDLSNVANATYLTTIFAKCSSLVDFETTGSIAGLNTFTSATLDVSASPVFNIELMLNRFASNTSGKTRTIKLHSTVYSNLTDDIRALATSKNYTLASA